MTCRYSVPAPNSFDASAGSAAGDFENGTITVTVAAGQLGARMLMDWNTSQNIDILNVWNINSVFRIAVRPWWILLQKIVSGPGDPTRLATTPAPFFLTSTDNDGDGTLGIPMTNQGPYGGGPFAGYSLDFNLHGNMTVVPVPAAAWLFGSGLPGLIGIARRQNKA